jgi:ribonuclease G
VAKEIVVNVGERETRIAVMEEGKLVELHIEREERVVGSLYKARVENVLPGMDAAFVDVGLERNAFLYVGDVLPTSEDESGEAVKSSNALVDLDDVDEGDDGADGEVDETAPSGEPVADGRRTNQRRRPPSTRRSVLRQQKIKDVLKIGQEILVQIIKGPRGTKGARVSTRISLPGRYLVLMPEADNIGVSRKIEDGKERDRLKRIGEKLREPGFGIIIRTEAEDKTEPELKADKEFLLKLWRQIQDTARKSRAPMLIHQDLTLVYKTIRDVFGSDVQKLILDDPVEYEKANELLDMVSPKLRGRIQLYTGETPVFDHFNIESEIEKSLKRKVWLRSGGYLIFDETEALTVIDVNTGKFVGASSLNETIVKTNTDAASEIARQLRLRDIGGIIVIDFIDMNNQRDKQQVIRSLENALKKDRSRTKISSISNLGLVEMTRKRTGETVSAFMSEPCTYCGGQGKLPSAETISLFAERELQRTAKAEKKPREALLIQCHPDVAEFLIGQDGENVDRIEREIQRAVYVRAESEQNPQKFDIVAGDITEFDKKYSSFRRSQIVECRIARSLLQVEPAVIGWADGYLLDLNDGKKWLGQKVKARITDNRRSYASAVVLPGTNRPLDRPEVI